MRRREKGGGIRERERERERERDEVGGDNMRDQKRLQKDRE